MSQREATIKFNVRKNQQPISQQFSGQLEKDLETTRMCLIKQIEGLSYLLRQGLAVRGHKETEGNLARLLKLRAIDVPELEHWCSEKENFSSDILNEQISIIGKSILRTLTHEIREVQWFSIIADLIFQFDGLEKILLLMKIR